MPDVTTTTQVDPLPHRLTRFWPSAAAAAWAAVIFGMSSLPGSAVPGRYGTIAHFLEYAVLAALVLWATHDRRLPTGDVVLAVALAAAWGVTDELHQAFVPLRVPDQVDWLVDVLGAIAGATVLSELLRARDRLARQ